jgi:ABC-2 type transport system permease protein
MRTLFRLISKELHQLRRDPGTLRLVFISPIVQLLLLGYAVNLDVANLRLAVCDLDRTQASRDFTDHFTRTGTFTLVNGGLGFGDVDRYLDDGIASMALVIPRGFADGMARGRTVTVQVIADGTESNSAGVGLSYASMIVEQYARRVTLNIFSRLKGRGLTVASVAPETRVWYNPALRSRYFMVPGVVAMVLMLMTMLMTSMAVVREKEIGTLEQLIVSPVRPDQLIIGKLAPFALLGLADVVIVLMVAAFWFHVPLKGSIPLLFLFCLLFEIATLGLGLFISTISRTQQQAMLTSQFFVLMPMIMLSGFAFPIENMPRVIQLVTYLMPMRYFLIIVRGIFLKGVGFRELWPQAAALLALGLAILTVSIARFRKRVA